MTHTKDKALKLAVEFDKRFTSMNGIDVPERVSVPRDEWRALHDAIKQALAADVQEPVAWRYDLKQTGSFAGTSTEYSRIKLKIGENWTPLYTTPPAAPVQPVAWDRPIIYTPPHMAPPAQQQWVGLTDEEIIDMYNEPRSDAEMIAFGREVEAKLKERNQ
jgi:hypothetical protein